MITPKNRKRMLTIKEASALIDGLTEYRIRRMCISGLVTCFRAGKKYLVSEKVHMKSVFGNCDPEGGDAA